METRTQNFVLVGVLVLLDASMYLIGWWLAYVLRMGANFLPYPAHALPEDYFQVVLIALPFWLIIFALCRLYDREELLGGPQEYGNIVKGCLIGFAALIAVSIFSKTPELPRGWLVFGLILTTLLIGIARFVTRRVFYSLRPRGWFVQRALIVGTNDDARAIARQLTPFPFSGVEVVGFVDDYLPIGTPVVDHLRVVAATPNLHTFTANQRIDQVILVSGAITWESLDQLLRGITLAREETYAIKLSPGLYETLTTGVRVSYKNRVPLLEIERAPITGIDALLKGSLDYTLGSLAFLIALPMMAVIGLTLKLFGAPRVLQPSPALGRNGETFKTYRFYSLMPDMPDWPRGRALGKFLFETGLDKLPQLWNVLAGKMSLVGPRPVDPANAARYQEWLPNLLSLKPGMTGARAASAENAITLEQEMKLELYYARNYSIWPDFQILFQTLMRMVHRERVLHQVESEAAPPRVEWQPGAVLPTEQKFYS